MQGLEQFTSHLLFLRKLLKDVLHRGVSQETGSCGIEEAGNPAQKRGEGSSGWGGRKILEHQLQRATNSVCKCQKFPGETSFKMMNLVESWMWRKALRKLWTIGNELEVKKKKKNWWSMHRKLSKWGTHNSCNTEYQSVPNYGMAIWVGGVEVWGCDREDRDLKQPLL